MTIHITAIGIDMSMTAILVQWLQKMDIIRNQLIRLLVAGRAGVSR